MLTSVTFFLLSCYSTVLCNSHGVFWTLVNKDVTIGDDLNLYCNESNCCHKRSTRRWFGGPNRELLYWNGISSYPSKYTSRLEDGGFYLTIHNVEEKDLNVSYACSVGIYEYTDILLPNCDTVVHETTMSTTLSMSTEPSISSNTTIGSKVQIFLIIVVVMVLIIAGGTGIACYLYRRKEIWKLIEDQTKTENSDQKSFQEGLQEDKVNSKRHWDERDMG